MRGKVSLTAFKHKFIISHAQKKSSAAPQNNGTATFFIIFEKGSRLFGKKAIVFRLCAIPPELRPSGRTDAAYVPPVRLATAFRSFSRAYRGILPCIGYSG